jgi:tyrosinase
MGTNGIFIPNRDPLYWPAIKQYIPVGSGGGCMPNGPFSNYTVDMGPIDSAGQKPVNYRFEYNPHCLARDLKSVVTQVSITFRNSTELILSYDTIDWFQGIMQKDPRFPAPDVPYGVHRGGHIGVGPVMGDAAGSPADPMFWIHHAQIDRIWTTWQGLDPGERRDAIWGTHTLADVPPSANMTLDEMLDFVLIAEPVKFGDLMDTLSGPFCYYYT